MPSTTLNQMPFRSECATCSFVYTALEDLMRATLGALANFNEDERMILVK